MSCNVSNNSRCTYSKRGAAFFVIAMISLCFVACSPNGDKVAGGGTGTSAGNTITARVLSVDGVPVAGTEVVLRLTGSIPDSIMVGPSGSMAMAPRKTLTDSLGFFRISIDSSTSYVLECKRRGDSTKQVLWVENLKPNGDGTTMNLGDLKLEREAVLSGHILKLVAGSSTPVSVAADKIWLGFPGTGTFVSADSGGTFTLMGIPSGSRAMTLLRQSAQTTWQTISVTGWRIAAGNHAVMDTLRLPPSSSNSALLSASACVENLTSMVEYEYAGPPSVGRSRVLRSYLYTNPLEWIELDPCLGTWRKLGPLPAAVTTATGFFSTEQTDHIFLGDLSTYLQLDTNAVVSQPKPLPFNLASVAYYGGKYYSIFWADSGLKIFPTESALFGGGSSDPFTFNFPNSSLREIAIQDSVAYFGSSEDTLHLYKYDLRTYRFELLDKVVDFKGVFYGITSVASPGKGLWLLNNDRDLFLYNPISHVIVQRIKVETPADIRGLTRFHHGED